MSLFPAYVKDSDDISVKNYVSTSQNTNSDISLALETRLLESDSEHEDSVAQVPIVTHHQKTIDNEDYYYVDNKWDYGNLRVSTLYYPGRPQYEWTKSQRALGQSYNRDSPRRVKKRRYYETMSNTNIVELETDAELSSRTKAFKQLIDEDPTNEKLWLQFIEFQERCRDVTAALNAAREAAVRLGRPRRVRAALYRTCALALSPHERLNLLRTDLAAAEKSSALETEMWLRLLSALSASAGGVTELDAAAAAAVNATRAHPSAYPHILYVYGAQLRAAGLWERLVLLLELVTSMNFPPACFPPPSDPNRATIERQLQETEDKVIDSGLPVSVVWVRVERLRAAAHWHGVRVDEAGADPQRAPLAADVAELLLPLRDSHAAFLLLVNTLRLAQVPVLPCAEYVERATHAAAEANGDDAGAATASTLAAILRAARRLPPAHFARAHPRDARTLLARAADPPHRFSAHAGYLEWETALWNACLEWTSGSQRVALLCWRLRWLHSLLLLLDMEEDSDRSETRRIRSEARGALKKFADGCPLAFAQFARVELAVSGRAAAGAVALQALRAALQDRECPAHHRLYIARVAGEVCAGDAAGEWALACAALARPLPDSAALAERPPPELLAEALQICEERCEDLERAFECEEDDACEWDGASACAALLPADAEWGCARAALAGPLRRTQLLHELCARASQHTGARASRYYEQSACALCVRGAREQRLAACARAAAPLYPHNAFLALACAGAPLWAWGRDASQEERARALAAPRTYVSALAHALPALLRAARTVLQPDPADWARAERACARAGQRGAGGALLATLRLDAAPHAPRARPDAALYDALHAYPNHKWLYVRGAAARPAQAATLADALLERQLRAHALFDELTPLHTPAQ